MSSILHDRITHCVCAGVAVEKQDHCTVTMEDLYIYIRIYLLVFDRSDVIKNRFVVYVYFRY